jgi:hypothetical protein
MTAMKATGSLTVLEAAFKIIPGKKPLFWPIRPRWCRWTRQSLVFGLPTAARLGTRHGYTSERALTVRSK